MACVCLLTSQKAESVLFARMLCLSLRAKGHTVYDYALSAPTVPQSLSFSSFDLLVWDSDDIPFSRLSAVTRHLPAIAYTQTQDPEGFSQSESVLLLKRPFAMQSFIAAIERLLEQPPKEAVPDQNPATQPTAETVREDAPVGVHPIYEKEDGIYYNTTRLPLSTTERALLSYLLRHRGQVCSRAELLRHIWKDEGSIQTNLVDVYIRYLRRKLDLAFDIRAILSVRNQGYLLR